MKLDIQSFLYIKLEENEAWKDHQTVAQKSA